MFIKKLWKRWVVGFDQKVLGDAIEKVAQEHNAPPDFKHFAMGMHKVMDPNYGPEDLTIEEADALHKWLVKRGHIKDEP